MTFLNIRMRCAIHSAESGSIRVILRENKLVRLDIQLNEVNKAAQQLNRSQITPEIVLKAALKIMSPYNLTYDYCDWWTAYRLVRVLATGSVITAFSLLAMRSTLDLLRPHKA